jgi:acyl-[acyl-carrier-protein]-phospholipid O-acyltransferase/long-chain-fatty-acid--[acyl-carrier-protein] ligase
MISLAAVEMLAADLWPNNITAVASIPDARKGERLIMVTDKSGATRSEFMVYARSRHASELMLPADVVVLDKLPMLGSGKVDQLAIETLVRDHVAAKAAAAAAPQQPQGDAEQPHEAAE